MTEQIQTPAVELVEQTIHQPSHRKKDFIESLQKRRLLYLGRAAMCEELIVELGGSIDDPTEMTTEEMDMAERQPRQRRRHGGQGGSQDREDDNTNMDGSPDLRKKENQGIRQQEGERRMEEDGDTRTSGGKRGSRQQDDSQARHPVKNASREPGSSPEAEGEPDEEMITKEGEPDKRYKPNETEAEYKARHMLNVPEGETDGRGQVTDPQNDLRLKRNLGKRAKIAARDGGEDDE